MSNRAVERVTTVVIDVLDILGVDIQKWGGVSVSPAAAKSDNKSNATVVPEIGSMVQTYNPGTASWDRTRSSPATPVNIAAAGFIGFQTNLPHAVYFTAPTTRSTGQGGPLTSSPDASLRTIATCPTGTASSVASSASNVTLLAANINRHGACIVNESTAILYLKLGATASATSYTVQMAGSNAYGAAYYEVPFGYTGVIEGIWASATGSARVTELT